MKRVRQSKHHRGGSSLRSLPKCPSGIRGLDEITGGGLPRGRPTLVCGSAGCGKTLFAAEFLIRGALEHGENGVLMSFEETTGEIETNVASLGFDLPRLVAQKKIAVDWVRVERSEIEESGEYDLEGLFVRIQHAVDTVGAKRIALDTLESLFGGLQNPLILRAELRRLFRWLKDRGLTAVITAERGEGTLTRYGLEEYVSDCVIVLDHRVDQEVSTRRLRVVKYRGSTHGTNEYPFLIDAEGFSVLPITSLRLEQPAPTARISTGVPRLDEMLGGRGYFRASTVLVSGSAGTGKSSLAAHFANSVCSLGERCLFFAYEESAEQILRNFRSVGIDLAPHRERGLLQIEAVRPFFFGLEMHLVSLHKLVRDFKPTAVIMDPVSNLSLSGSFSGARSVLTRIIDYLKMEGITCFFTSLTASGDIDDSEVGISSLIDSWISLRSVESGGERNRLLTIIKSRGMHHSNQLSEFLLTKHGMQLVDTYLGPTGVLTGSARVAQEERDRREAELRRDDCQRMQRLIEQKGRALEARLTELKASYESDVEELARQIAEVQQAGRDAESARGQMARSRVAFAAGGTEKPRKRS